METAKFFLFLFFVFYKKTLVSLPLRITYGLQKKGDEHI